jgi:hypothetical protein
MNSHAQDKTLSADEGLKDDLHVYLLIGQSNMSGRAPYTKEEEEIIPRCYLLNGQDVWEPAKNPLNKYSTIRKKLGSQRLNPGYSFSQEMLAKDKDICLGLVVNAKGGSKIEEWSKDSRFYQEAVRRARAATTTGTLKGVLWHQGEANSRDPDYLEKLSLLIENLRSDLDTPELPFVAGQIKNPSVPINLQIAKLPETVAATGVASSEGLTTMDRAHFDAESHGCPV